MGRIAPGGVAGSKARTRAAAAPLAVSLVLVATLAGCLFSSESPAPSADASGALPTAAASVAVSPGTSPGASPGTSPSPSTSPSGPTKPTPCPGSNRNPGAAAGRQFSGSSTNWSGYVSAVKKTGVTCVEGSWIEPAVTCPRTGHQAVAIWIGIDGFSAKTLGIPSTDVLVQVGTQATCTNGVAAHEAWHEILPGEAHEVPIAAVIHAGDHMSAKVSYANGRFTLVLFDADAQGLFSITAPAPGAPRKTAEWIVEAPATDCPGSCAPLPLPNFGSVRFTGAFATIAGQRASINDASWSNVKLRMARRGVTRTTVTSLSSGGTSFRVAWKHS